jgi:hypothetical protein
LAHRTLALTAAVPVALLTALTANLWSTRPLAAQHWAGVDGKIRMLQQRCFMMFYVF